MNILLCTSRMGIGGAETHIFTLAGQLSKLGHRVCVASSGGGYAPLLEKAGIEHVILPLDSRTPISITRSYFGLVYLAERFGADIVHAHGRIPAFVCGLAERFSFFPPFVTTAHGLYDSREPLRSLSEWGASTVAVSREVESYLNNVYGLSHDTVTFIPNGVSVPETNLYTDADGTETVISASARMDFDNEEAFLLLLSVFEALLNTGKYRGLQLKLAGEGSSYYRIKAESDRINFRFPGSVKMCGSVTDVRSFLEGSTVFVGQSRSALEAMAMGIPTVLFNNSGCAGVLTDENSTFLFGRNYIPEISGCSHRTLSDSLVQLLESTDKRHTVSDFSYRFVKTHNNLEDIAIATLGVYRRTLDKFKKDVLLCGYFGAGNTGDELALRLVSGEIRKAAPGAEISVITRSRKDTPQGLHGISRTDFRSIRLAMKKARVLCLCGGTLIQNFTSMRSLIFYSRILKNARSSGCRLMVWGGGIGPLTGHRGYEIAKKMLSSLDTAGLRDIRSFNEAKRLGCTDAYLSADAVSASPASFIISPDERNAVFTVCPRRLRKTADREKLLSVFSEAIKKLCKSKNLKARIVPLAPEDTEICEALGEICGCEVYRHDTPENTEKLIAESKFCLAVRLHSAILAFRSRVPFVAVSYDPKVSAFAEAVGEPYIELKDLTADAIITAAERLSVPENTDELLSEMAVLSRKDPEAFRRIYD